MFIRLLPTMPCHPDVEWHKEYDPDSSRSFSPSPGNKRRSPSPVSLTSGKRFMTAYTYTCRQHLNGAYTPSPGDGDRSNGGSPIPNFCFLEGIEENVHKCCEWTRGFRTDWLAATMGDIMREEGIPIDELESRVNVSELMLKLENPRPPRIVAVKGELDQVDD